MRIRVSFWFSCLAVLLTAVGCVTPIEHNLPPAERLMHPGPGVDGPGPGVMVPPASMMPPLMGAMPSAPPAAVQVLFAKPEGMQVRWDVFMPGTFDSTPLVVPGRQNFPQQNIYRMKLTNIAGREGVELYPTLEIGPTTPRTEAYLAHNALPIQYTDEDFDQVLSGNFVTKVIYLPDPEFQELALANVEILVSTRLDPGIDPITEADRRGAILAVVRLGNKDVELPGANGDAPSVLPGMYQDEISGGIGGPGGLGGGYGGPAGFGGRGGALAMGPTTLVPQHVAGVTAPQWGMPYVGTPLGLTGPPHIPMGGPAGLQSHTMRNHTRTHIPGPTHHLKMHVKQRPGFSYPEPANRIRITEQMIQPSMPFNQPRLDRHECVY